METSHKMSVRVMGTKTRGIIHLPHSSGGGRERIPKFTKCSAWVCKVCHSRLVAFCMSARVWSAQEIRWGAQNFAKNLHVVWFGKHKLVR